MKKLIVCLLTLIFSQPIHAHNLADAIEESLPSITYIEVENHTSRKIIDTSNKTIREVRERSGSSIGTGFVIEGNKIVTNYHVISRVAKHQEKVYVKFYNNNGIRYEATLIGYDEVADIALLEIEGTHPSLTIAEDAGQIRMGDDVFTISNFYSIRHSATQGIVSSSHRANSRFPYVRLMQLQVLQGSGSSGGPVINDDGQVVGINHTILSMVPDSSYKEKSPQLMSMTSFSIRGDQVAESIRRIKTEGVVIREDLGLYLSDYGMTSERYLYNPVPNSKDISGVLITGMDTVGTMQFMTDDIIVSIDGQYFTSATRLLRWLDENTLPLDEVKLQVYRSGELLNITATVKAAERF